MAQAHPATAVPVPRKVGELVGIQYLRGIAAMLVVFFHLQPQLIRMGYGGGWLPGLSSGVDIFFVISGFIMWVTTCGRPIGTLEFWRRRIVRIVPLYWLVTSFAVAVMLAAPNAAQTSRFDLRHVIASYLFVPAMHPVKPVMEPVVMPGWTLNYEMFFYAIFGLFLLTAARTRLIGTVAALLALVAAGTIFSLSPLTIAGFFTSSVMLEFAMGVALGAIATRGDAYARLPAWAGWLMVGVGLGVVVLAPVWSGEPPRAIVRGIPSIIIVAGMLTIEARRALPRVPLLREIGDASYSIYLTHFIVQSAASQAWRKLHFDKLPGGLVLFCIAATVGVTVVGWLCYRFIEKPLGVLLSGGRRDGAVVRPVPA